MEKFSERQKRFFELSVRQDLEFEDGNELSKASRKVFYGAMAAGLGTASLIFYLNHRGFFMRYGSYSEVKVQFMIMFFSFGNSMLAGYFFMSRFHDLSDKLHFKYKLKDQINT